MRAYEVTSWADSEFYLDKEKAEARSKELRDSVEEQDINSQVSGEPILSEVFEIEIFE